ncbi:Fic/DOC family protein [Nocardioides humi]|uniref:protein adenylyltransferase n=1 Tax=Nocardioides humi TaxID=449461 RepID=A0ABN2B315_9ACTN|nr:Fic family protein [Nocardioides humi]
MPDHYAYPGTDVLVNLPGITDRAAWKDAETLLVVARLSELLVSPIPGRFDLAHLQAIHAHLVDGFYAWGGQLRVTETGPGGTGITHCRPQFIPAEAERIFTALAERDHLRGLDADAFSAGLAWAWGETTVLHPFRDVNTRSQYVFFNQLARQAGWVIGWSQIDPYLFGYARTVSMVSDERGLDALLRPALIPLTEVEADPELADRIHDAARTFFNPSTPRTFEVLDQELRQAIDHRQTLPSSREPGPSSSATGAAAEVDYGPEIDLDAAAERLRRTTRRAGRLGLRPPNPGSSNPESPRLRPSEPISPPSSSRPEPPSIGF